MCPVFLKSSLHINIGNLAHGGDDGFNPQTASGRVHSLDSNYTTDVLRYSQLHNSVNNYTKKLNNHMKRVVYQY